MKEGQGVVGVFPPLAKSDYLNADKGRAIQILKKGLSGPITVNGQKYNNVMPHLELSNEEIASVLSYVYNQWGNKGIMVSEAEVK